ncbi:MAG: adenine phosphoribosyltransferase [Firmicutes bacterium]|jgi:adenine phosphoribosyltransferase|nr:adenine phosphoribosyltransferase [Bacillota bacterium]
MDLKSKIRVIPDFPEPGISFKDITTLLQDGPALREAVRMMADAFRDDRVDVVVGVESRGFIFGSPIAYELGVGFVIVRKPGKLPSDTYRVEYALEYGTDALEMHKDAIKPGQRVLIVDDLLATGGTIAAAADLVRRAGGEIVGYSFLIELAYLNGRERLKGERIHALVRYDD